MKYLGYFLCALELLLSVHPMNGEWNLYGKMSDKPMTEQADSEWQPIGEMVEMKESEMANEDETLEDSSDPKIVSDSVCADVLMALDSAPEKVTEVLDGLKLDQARRPRGRCFRSRDYPAYRDNDGPRFSGSRHGSFCYGPLYVVYGRYRYCCRNYYEHPLVQRRGRRVRCRCLYDY
ncbi:uncharacterized protein [Palaemon carinicauda]|uniref:uncharacterized protein n=1 Tax=Palaemon carinicauda TaxID=392227 RepID=UPI0035B635F5